MKKMFRPDNSFLLYGGALTATVLCLLALRLALPASSFIFSFLFRCWPIQGLSSLLFVIGIVYWGQRYSLFRNEELAFHKVRLPDFSIYQEQARGLIDSMPETYKKTLSMRRFLAILQAFSYGEDIIRLNEELSRGDRAAVEQGHALLSSLRNIIPVMGFLGTVIGLSFGMIAFPDVTDLQVLREALKNFAASLSVAFDTTLLALGYTIVIIILTSFLRQREEVLVGRIDEQARLLIGKIKVESRQQAPTPQGNGDGMIQAFSEALLQWKNDLAGILQGFAAELSAQNAATGKQMEAAVKDVGTVLADKLEELKAGMHRPPRYEIIVQPVQREGAGDEAK